MMQARFAGYIVSLMATGMLAFHCWQVDKQGKEINYPYTLALFGVACFSLGVPIQDFNLGKMLGINKGRED